MSTFDDNVNILRRVREDMLGVSAVTCTSAGDTSEGGDPRIDTNGNRVYTTRDGGRTVIPTWINGKFPMADDDTGIPVRIARNYAGEWEVIGGDSQLGDIRHGAASITKLFPRLIGELLKLVIPGKNLQPGRLILTSDSTGLKVTLAPFWYVDSAGDLKKWRGEVSGTLTRSVPGSNTHRWTFIEFDPDATTPALSAQTMTAVAIPTPIKGESERIPYIQAFTPTAGYLPAWAVYERTGMTALDFESGIEDVRLWMRRPLEIDVIDLDDRVTTLETAGGTTALPQGSIVGGEVACDGTNVTIAALETKAESNNYVIRSTSTLTINPATTGANGLDAGSLANDTWYYAWAIAKSSDGTTAGLLSTSSTAPTLPSGYDRKRRVGAVRTNGSAALYQQITMAGAGCLREVVYREAVDSTAANAFRILNSANIAQHTSWTDVDCSAVIPPTSRKARFSMLIESAATGFNLFYREYNVSNQKLNIAQGDAGTNGFTVDLPLDSSQRGQVSSDIAGDEDLYVLVLGYFDNLLPTITGTSGAS